LDAGFAAFKYGGYLMQSEFINHVPGILSAANRIACLKATRSDFEYMSTINGILKNTGCDKFGPIINDIVNASKIGENEFAASCARIFLLSFSAMFDNPDESGKIQDLIPAAEYDKIMLNFFKEVQPIAAS